MAKDKLVTRSYVFILAANFLLYFGFYLLLPILPFYLTEVFHSTNTAVGIILSSYTIAALCIRPFSGYMLDTFSRKPLYLVAFFIFMSIFSGYILAGTLTLFTILRIAHGLAFGAVTVAGNTVVIDIMPSSRRGEGLGYYGLMNNIAMSIGPMVGLFMHETYCFEVIFTCALISCSLGFIVAALIKVPTKAKVKQPPISLDRFISIKGIPAGIDLLLLSIPYGMTTTYIAMYAKEIGITHSTGLFFTFMALGMAVSRLFSGKQVDKGKIVIVISWGMSLVSLCFFILAACETFMNWNSNLATYIFFGCSLFLGIGFGTMFPAFNTLFVNLAPNEQRGTATSTYLTAWDIGIGIGLVIGGYIGQIATFDKAFLFGAFLSVIAIIYFRKVVGPHFELNKLR